MASRFTYGHLMILAGLVLLVIAAVRVVQHRQDMALAAEWPVVEGRLVSVGYEVVDTRTKYGAGWYYRPALRYRYEVGGTTHKGREAWLGRVPRFQSVEETEAFLSDFAEGDRVAVRHDPADPAQSALFVQPEWERGLGFAISGAVLVILGAGLQFALRSPHKAA